MFIIQCICFVIYFQAKPEDTLDLCKILNDDMAGIVNKYPFRFIGLGTLPMQAPELAVQELKRCVQQLGFPGVQIGSHVNDWNLDAWGRREVNYCFPPFALIPQVLQAVAECRAWAVLILPNWPSQTWWVRLMEMVVRIYEFPERVVFERPVRYGWKDVPVQSFQPIAVVVDGATLPAGC